MFSCLLASSPSPHWPFLPLPPLAPQAQVSAPTVRSGLAAALAPHAVRLACCRHGSPVLEAVLKYGSDADREVILTALLGGVGQGAVGHCHLGVGRQCAARVALAAHAGQHVRNGTYLCFPTTGGTVQCTGAHHACVTTVIRLALLCTTGLPRPPHAGCGGRQWPPGHAPGVRPLRQLCAAEVFPGEHDGVGLNTLMHVT